MELLLLLVIVVAALSGAGLGFVLGSRQAAAMRAERDDNLQKFRDAIKDLATAEERARAVPELAAKLEDMRTQCASAQQECARLSAGQEEREKAFEARLKELAEARTALSAQFSEIGAKLLGEAQKNFLERADARFHQANEKSEEKLKALLQPVETTLKRYEDGLKQVEKDRVGSYGELKAA